MTAGKFPKPVVEDIDRLVAAAKRDDVDGISAFVKAFGRRGLDAKDSKGDTALTRAARLNQRAAVHCLLQLGADPNARDSHRGTALMDAAVEGHVEVIRALLDKGADVDLKSYAHVTALWYAKVNKHAEAAALIEAAPQQRAEAHQHAVESCTEGLETPVLVSKPLRLKIH